MITKKDNENDNRKSDSKYDDENKKIKFIAFKLISKMITNDK
jgi:hypothetical protein